MKTERIKLHKSYLKDNLKKLLKAAELLSYSYYKNNQIVEKDNFSIDELEKLESLAARFSRAADILTQKVLKGFYIMIQEPVATFIDMSNLAEKSGFVDDAETLIALRDLRNHIAHEYEDEQLILLYKDIIDACPELLNICETINKSLQKYIE